VTALSLSAVDSLWWESSIALSADHLLALEFSGEGSKGWLDLDLSHTSTSESQDQVKGRLLLDVVVGEGSSILELLSSEDESLLVWRDTFLVLDLGLDVLDGISWLDIKSDGLSSEGFDEDLHSSSKSQDQVESRLLLDVVVGEGSAVFELLTSEDKSLLIRWDTFFVLDLSLDVFDGVCWLDIKGDSLTSEGLNEDLHTTSKSENKMESGLLLDVVVREGSAVLELLTSEDKSLLIWGNTLLVLDLGLDVLNGVCGLNIKSDGLTSQGLDEDLHTSSKSKDEMEG